MSQEIEEGPRVDWNWGKLLLSYGVRDPSGELARQEVAFAEAIAYMFVSFEHCSAEHANAYDRLVEVTSSRWLPTLRDVTDDVKHFRIFFDDFGCFEIAAKTFVPPPATNGA